MALAATEAWTWKAGGSWEPGYGIKIRGNYSRAVRAPNIGELFTPLVVGLTNLGIDPCAGSGSVNNANLRAVCLAQGAPVGTIGLITNPTAAQANIVTGGNLELEPEKANTWTLGVVFQPEFLPRFSMSLDYYNIKVTDLIGAAAAGRSDQRLLRQYHRCQRERSELHRSFGATRSPAASTAIRRPLRACSPRPTIAANCSPTVST